MLKKLIIATFSSFLLTEIVHAECTPYHFYEQNVQFSRQSPDPQTCWLSVKPDGKRLVYRNYLFDQHGFMMIFNSYGNGPNTTHTGARIFYFLPVYPRAPHLIRDQDYITVTTSSQLQLTIDPQSGRWVQVNEGQVKEDARIRRDNQGGIEFSNLKKVLLLDAGFTLGRDPRWNPKNFSRLTDSRNQTCQINNHLIYKYDEQGDIQMRYPHMQDLHQLLILHCGHLDLSPFDPFL